MSVPLGGGAGPAGGAARQAGTGTGSRPSGSRPTGQQLLLARERARVTGESVAQALSVFMGAGRYGQPSGTSAAEAPLSAAPAAPAPSEGDDVADVIPLSRGRRRRGNLD